MTCKTLKSQKGDIDLAVYLGLFRLNAVLVSCTSSMLRFGVVPCYSEHFLQEFGRFHAGTVIHLDHRASCFRSMNEENSMCFSTMRVS